MFKKYHFILTLLLGFTLISTVSCKQGASSEYSVLESGYNAFKKTHWVDNERVIFSGYPSGLPKNNDQKGLYIWNIKTGKVKFHAKLSKSNTNFCYGDNVIVYDLEKLEDGIEKHIYMEGPLGQEKVSTSYQIDPDNGQKSPYTCIKEAPPSELKDHRWRPLKADHGYLDYGLKNIKERRKQPPVLYFLRADGERIALPVNNESWLVKGYYSHKNAYLLLPNGVGDAQEKHENWKRTGCLEGYWLFPDGKTEQICHPYSEAWGKALIPLYPVKSGLVITTHNISGRKRFTDAAGYLLKDGELVKLINGQLTVLSTSPDGCKIAFVHARDWDDIRQGQQLKIINTCK